MSSLRKRNVKVVKAPPKLSNAGRPRVQNQTMRNAKPPTPPRRNAPPPPKVVNINYLIGINTKAHRTDYYAITQTKNDPALVIRRGKAFHIQIKFEKDMFPNLDMVQLLFRHKRFVVEPDAPGNQLGLVSMVFDISDPEPVQVKDWNGTIVDGPNRHPRFLQLAIVPSAGCMIGQWQMIIQTKSPGRKFEVVDKFDYLHILCNPWCEDDDCYVRTQRHPSGNPRILTPDELDDCVINDTGCIFMGTRQQVECRPWHYAQFDEGVLMYVYSHLNRMPARNLQKPIEIAKYFMQELERLILTDFANMGGKFNQLDYKNVVLYYSGTSGVIGGKIMKLGMGEKLSVTDHVLAALFTSLCRAIGIPSRCVTCYDCMPPVPWKAETRYRWSESGKLTGKEGGSRWAYHVWSEIYCKRIDLLNTRHDGWQLFDHNRSGGVGRRMLSFGPASMHAIKNERLDDAEDTEYFVRSISEPINHTITTTGHHGAGQHLVTPFRCGSLIVTKKTGLPPNNCDVCSGMVRDITTLYKEPDIESLHDILVHDYETGQVEDSTQEVEFGLKMFPNSLKHAKVGEDFGCNIWATNTSEEDSRRINARLAVYAVNQYGEDRTLVFLKEFWKDYELKPMGGYGDKHMVRDYVDIGWERYKNALKPGNHFQLVLIASSKIGSFDKPQHTIIMEDFQLRLPNILIRLKEDASTEQVKREVRHLTIGQTKRMWITFINPLPVQIKDWFLTVEGAGIKAQRVEGGPEFQVGQSAATFSAAVNFTPTTLTRGRVGTLIVTFHHPYLQGAFGSRKFMVHPAPNKRLD